MFWFSCWCSILLWPDKLLGPFPLAVEGDNHIDCSVDDEGEPISVIESCIRLPLPQHCPGVVARRTCLGCPAGPMFHPPSSNNCTGGNKKKVKLSCSPLVFSSRSVTINKPTPCIFIRHTQHMVMRTGVDQLKKKEELKGKLCYFLYSISSGVGEAAVCNGTCHLDHHTSFLSYFLFLSAPRSLPM